MYVDGDFNKLYYDVQSRTLLVNINQRLKENLKIKVNSNLNSSSQQKYLCGQAMHDAAKHNIFI